MEKEFAPYEIALVLKELGFNEPCFANWIKRDSRDGGGIVLEMLGDERTEYMVISEILAPTFSQAFRWFREKYKMKIWFNISQQVPYADKYLVSIDVNDGFGVGTEFEEEFTTYHEAELECLKKLIEIAKYEQGKNSLRN